MLRGPVLLKFLIYASLDPFGPWPAITYPICLHGNRCVIRAGNRNFLDRSLLGRSLLNRSRGSSGARLTGASGWGLCSLLQVPVGLTRCHLGPPGQWDTGQVGVPMEVALLSHQSMIVAPLARQSLNIEGK